MTVKRLTPIARALAMFLALATLLALASPAPALAQAGRDQQGEQDEERRDQRREAIEARRAADLARALGDPRNRNVGPCPLIGVLYDSQRTVEFRGDGGERFANVGFTGEMRGVRGLCRYREDEPIVMSLEIDMAFGRGPAAMGEGRHVYRYWVAVTRKDVAPMAKEYFEVEARFPGDAERLAGVETIEGIVIPRANPTVSGENFEILVGFELTPEQLDFNRDGKRFRVDVGG